MPALKQQLGPGGFPIAIGFAMLILACIYAWQQFRGGMTAKETEEEIEKRAAIIGAEEKIEKKADLKTMGFILGLMLLYAFFFEILGYAISTFLMFMAGYALPGPASSGARRRDRGDIEFRSVLYFHHFAAGSASRGSAEVSGILT